MDGIRPPAEHVGWHSRDGTVLVTWPDVWPDEPDWDEPDERRWTVARLDGDEWRLLGEPLTLPGDAEPEFYVTDEGDLWAWIWSNMDGIWMSRWDDGRWIRDDSRMRVEGPFDPLGGDDHVAPDGSRWWNNDPDWDRESDPCRSVVRFDGLQEDRFLTAYAPTASMSVPMAPSGRWLTPDPMRTPRGASTSSPPRPWRPPSRLAATFAARPSQDGPLLVSVDESRTREDGWVSSWQAHVTYRGPDKVRSTVR